MAFASTHGGGHKRRTRIVRGLSLMIVSLFAACAYKPMAYYANKALGDSVYVTLKVNLENPEDSIKIKDVINEAITSRFHSKLEDKEHAETILNVSVLSVRDDIIATDTHGFAKFYRIFVDINFSFKKLDKTVNYTNNGYYDYAASVSNPAVTYNNRSNAIIEATRQSIDKFISQVGYEGASGDSW